MLSHDNLGFDAQVSLACGFEGIEPGRDVISVLPYSHIYEHTMIYIYLIAKVRYFICHDPNELLDDLRDVRPAAMTAVPRIFDRVMAGVKGQARAAGGARGRLVPWALRIGRKYASAKTFVGGRADGSPCNMRLRKGSCWRRYGARWARSRAVPHQRQRRAAHRYRDDVPRYGRSDHARIWSHRNVARHVRQPADGKRVRRGRKPITGVEVRIAGDGEVLVRGRNVMQGYYRDPASDRCGDRRRLAAHRRHRRDRCGGVPAHHRSEKRDLQDGHRQVGLAGAHRSEHQALDFRSARDGGRQRASLSDRADLAELAAACVWSFRVWRRTCRPTRSRGGRTCTHF